MTTSAQTEDRMPLEIRGARLRLVAITAELARLQIEDRPAFFKALGAEREAAWPPVTDDEPKLAEKLEILNRAPEEAGWRGWVFLMGWTPDGLDGPADRPADRRPDGWTSSRPHGPSSRPPRPERHCSTWLVQE